MEKENLQLMEKDEIMNFIREKLSFKEEIYMQLRHLEKSQFDLEHRRFEMSGYDYIDHRIKISSIEFEPKHGNGSCTLHNTDILNEFAYLGIYDYTSYLFLDFYKGSVTLYLQYWNEKENLEIDLTCYGTREIIYEIFKYTIFSGKGQRRRF